MAKNDEVNANKNNLEEEIIDSDNTEKTEDTKKN